jgi:hypothetical protein
MNAQHDQYQISHINLLLLAYRPPHCVPTAAFTTPLSPFTNCYNIGLHTNFKALSLITSSVFVKDANEDNRDVLHAAAVRSQTAV